jgi:hypothetical protein
MPVGFVSMFFDRLARLDFVVRRLLILIPSKDVERHLPLEISVHMEEAICQYQGEGHTEEVIRCELNFHRFPPKTR